MKKLLIVVAFFGCTAGVKPAQVGTGGTGGSAAPGAGGNAGGGTTGAGTGGTTGAAGNGTGTAGATGTGNTDGGGVDGTCAAESVSAVPVPLDLYFLMDSSKSMADNTGAGTSKWVAVRSALGTFFSDAGSAGLGVALKYFPDEQSGAPATCASDGACGSYGPCDYRLACVRANTSSIVDTGSQLCQNATTTCTAAMETCERIQDCGTGNNPCVANGTGVCAAGCMNYTGYCHLRDVCTSSKYAAPDVALMTLPGGASALSTSLTGHTPDGYTPTGPALAGAISWAQGRLTSTPDHKVAVVLVTDGLPGGFIPGFPPAECMPSDVATIGSSILAPAATANPPILTFVVGIFNPASQEGTLAPANLKTLAMAGGTGDAVIIDVTQNTVTQQLHDALQQAQTKAIACSYKIPAASGTKAVDPTKVNVNFTSGAGAVMTIGHTTSKDACTKGGWYYDIDPSVGTPTQIIACPSTCAQFNTDTSGSVDIVLGCMTIMVS